MTVGTADCVANQHFVVGLFPWSTHFGGIQVTVEEAWHAVLSSVGPENAAPFHYEAGSSKVAAIWRTMRLPSRPTVVLVWHIHLLKLLPALNFRRSRVVLFLHGIEAWHRQNPLTQRLLRWVDLVLANSEFTWSRFISHNPAWKNTPHRVVHLGVGLPLRGPSPAPALTPSAAIIGRIDRREDYKGHRELIAVWPHVLKRIPSATLRVVGDGDLRPALEELWIRRGGGPGVQFLGNLGTAEKENVLRESRCVVMPSRGEGFGLVYLEGMRLGRPCLVSADDAGREVVNPPDAGLSVNPRSADALTNAVTRLLADGPEWRSWSQGARARYESQFTSEHFRSRLVTALFG